MHRVETHLQIRNPGALALARLESGDRLAPLVGALPQCVELAVKTVADVAGFARAARPAQHHARLVHQRLAQELRHLGHGIRTAHGEPATPRGLQQEMALPFPRRGRQRVAERGHHGRQRLERSAQTREVARGRRRTRHLCQQALEVAPASRGDPAGETSRAERRRGPVEAFDQRVTARSVLHAAEQLEVRSRDRVEDHGIREAVVAQSRHLGQREGLMRPQVGQQRGGRPRGRIRRCRRKPVGVGRRLGRVE